MQIEKTRPVLRHGRQKPARAAVRRMLLLVGLVSGSATMTHPALAYTDAEIATFLRRRFSCSVLAPTQTLSAQVRGAGGPVQVFLYGAEGCPAIPFAGVSFAAVAPSAGGVGLLMPTPVPEQVESVAIADGYIVATSLGYAPSDPRCCPSRRVRQRWVVSGDRIVRAP